MRGKGVLKYFNVGENQNQEIVGVWGVANDHEGVIEVSREEN